MTARTDGGSRSGSDAGPFVGEPTATADAAFDQRAIDDFLGLGGDGAVSAIPSGIHALIDAPTVPYERIPMLEAVFDRLVKLLRTSARKLTSDLVEIRLDSIRSLRFGQYLDSISLPCLIGVVKAEPWNNFGLMMVDSGLVYALVEVALGGSATLGPTPVEGRTFSPIEMSILRRFVEAVLADSSEAFSSISPVAFSLDHFETNPRFASITQPQNLVVLATFKIDLGTLQGFFEIVLPFVTLEPIREALSSNYVGDRLGNDDVWQQHLVREFRRSEIELTAVLQEKVLPLGHVLGLAVGETLMLDISTDHLVEMRCGGKVVGRGRMGRAGDHIAVQMTQGLAELSAEKHLSSERHLS